LNEVKPNIRGRIVRGVGFRASTQPTINVVLHKGNGRAIITNINSANIKA